MSGVKGIIGMHICLVLSLSCSGVKTPLGLIKYSYVFDL